MVSWATFSVIFFFINLSDQISHTGSDIFCVCSRSSGTGLNKVSRDADTWPEATCPNRALLYIWHLGRALSSLALKLNYTGPMFTSLHFKRRGEKRERKERKRVSLRT